MSLTPSPVPADEFLLPGESPFTDFGQWGPGRMDLRVFDQDVFWVDRLGNPHLLTEMPQEYKLNVLAFLENNVESFYAACFFRAVTQVVSDLALGTKTSHLPGLDPAAIAELTPLDWLKSTPLYLQLSILTYF
jgi:hypothetical protein